MEGWDRMVSKRNKQEKWKLGKGHERMGGERKNDMGIPSFGEQGP